MAKAKSKAKKPAPKGAKPAKASRSKADPSPFVLTAADAVLNGFSKSDQFEGDDKIPAFTFRVEGVRWLKPQVDAYFGPYTWSAWFNTDAATKLEEPMPFWQRRKKGDFKVDDKFQIGLVDIKGRNATFKFRPTDHKSDDGETPAATISKLSFRPQPGGIVLVGFALTVRPKLDASIADLIDNQYGHVKLTLSDITAGEARSKQGELALPPAQSDNAESQLAH
jgi:hypothetical protein